MEALTAAPAVRLRSGPLAGLLVVLALGMVLCWLNRPWLARWLAEAGRPAAAATYPLNDWAAFDNAARMIASGAGPTLYDIAAQRAAEAREWGARFDLPLAVPFVNPPWFALALVPLAGWPVGAGFLAWIALSTALVLGAHALLAAWARPPPLVAAAFICAPFGFLPFWRLTIPGQSSAVVLFGLAAGTVALARGYDGRGGAALALAGVKPQLLVLPLLALLAGRRPRPLLACAAASAALLATALPVTGWGVVADYITLLRSPDYKGYENLPQMQTWRALVEGTFGIGGLPATVLDAAGMIGAVALVGWAWWPQARGPVPDWDLRMALTILATPLFAPHLHLHDLVIWAVPGALLLHHLYAPETARRWGKRHRRAGFILLWAGYAVVWPAWLLPDARLALLFSLGACAWIVAELRRAPRAGSVP